MEKINGWISEFFQRLKPVIKPHWINIFFLLIGVLLRLYFFLLNRSLWVDEASLTLNILDRNWLGLLQPLAHEQGAPIGFLWLEKTVVHLLGSGEMALRLVPLLAGLAALLVFYFFLKRHFSPWGTVFGLGLFAFSEPLIYYSSEVKQYSLDVLVCLIIVWFGLDLLQKPEKRANWLKLALFGILAVWLSHPAALVLAAAGLTYMGYAFYQKKYGEAGKMAGLAVLWLISFAALFFLSLRHLLGSSYLNIFWEDGFLPLTPSFSQIHWLITRYFGIFGSSDIGMAVPVVGAILTPLGLIHLLHSKKDKLAVLLMVVLIVAVIVAALEFYPFLGRMLLYLIPVFLLLTTAGFEWFLEQEYTSRELILVLLVLICFAQPLKVAAVNVKIKRSTQDFRPILEFVQQNFQEDDIVFVNTPARNNLEYYQRRLDFYPEHLVVLDNEENFWGHYMNYIEFLDGTPRVWVVLSHYYSNENRMFESALISRGEEISSLHLNNADAWLFDLR